MFIVAILLVPFRFWLDCAIIEAVGAILCLRQAVLGVVASKRGYKPVEGIVWLAEGLSDITLSAAND
jgi:hypothetical protein